MWAAAALAPVVVAGALAGAFAGTSGTNGTATSPTTAPTSISTGASGTGEVALSTAWNAEQRAKATYDAVVTKFGAVQPFSRVSDAEEQHLATLANLAARHRVSLPSGTFSDTTVPESLAEACGIGVSTEQDIVAMYTQLLSQVSSYPDLTRAFTNLRAAARDDHLPAFERCVGTATPTGSGATASTSSTVEVALSTAWNAEQQAEATYDAVIAKFGAVQPFTRISDAEGEHVAAVASIAARYGISLPSGSFSGVTPPATLTEACAIGVSTEQAVVAMYDRLLSEVTGYPDVTQAFTNLQAAARDNHLPAFERCA